MALVEVNEQGQLTLPPEARAALHLRGAARLEYEVVDGGIVLRAAIPPEDAWAYTPEMRERRRRAQTQRGYRLGSHDLEKIAADAETAHREGREYHVSEAELAAMEVRNLAADA